MTHPKAKHQVCELCCIRRYQTLSPIGTCEACTEKLRAQHEVDFLKRQVADLAEAADGLKRQVADLEVEAEVEAELRVDLEIELAKARTSE